MACPEILKQLGKKGTLILGLFMPNCTRVLRRGVVDNPLPPPSLPPIPNGMEFRRGTYRRIPPPFSAVRKWGRLERAITNAIR